MRYNSKRYVCSNDQILDLYLSSSSSFCSIIIIIIMPFFLYKPNENNTKQANTNFQITNSVYFVRVCVCVSFQMRQMTITAITTITTTQHRQAAADQVIKLINFHKLQHRNAFMFDFLMTTSTLQTTQTVQHYTVLWLSFRAPQCINFSLSILRSYGRNSKSTCLRFAGSKLVESSFWFSSHLVLYRIKIK